jgi:hypothetical protein
MQELDILNSNSHLVIICLCVSHGLLIWAGIQVTHIILEATVLVMHILFITMVDR